MPPSRTFLTAEWRWLVMLNYAAPPAALLPLVPAGLELDSFDGIAYALASAVSGSRSTAISRR